MRYRPPGRGTELKPEAFSPWVGEWALRSLHDAGLLLGRGRGRIDLRRDVIVELLEGEIFLEVIEVVGDLHPPGEELACSGVPALARSGSRWAPRRRPGPCLSPTLPEPIDLLLGEPAVATPGPDGADLPRPLQLADGGHLKAQLLGRLADG
jgi:hypothetical protein